MSVVLALALGLLIGSAPTADWLAWFRRIDLRRAGTGNPGTNNAFRLGGPRLGVAVLVVEIAKGLAAVWLGDWLADDPGAALAGVAATLGNVYNPWYGLRGGKGLAITAGTVAAAWPAMVAALALVIGVGVAVVRRSGPAALLSLAVYLSGCVLGLSLALPGVWAIDDPAWLLVLSAGQSAVIAPKHLADTLRSVARPGFRG